MIYAETLQMRSRQIIWDLAVVAWTVLWLLLGMHLHDLVTVLAIPGEGLSDVGTSLASGADRIATALEGTPLVGGEIAEPFSALGDAGEDLAGVGEEARHAALRLALWLSVSVAGVAVAVVAAPYLFWRVRWSRRATVTARLRDEPETARLLAFRAVVGRPLEEVVRISSDPLRDVQERPLALAALELRELGLRGRSDETRRTSRRHSP